MYLPHLQHKVALVGQVLEKLLVVEEEAVVLVNQVNQDILPRNFLQDSVVMVVIVQFRDQTLLMLEVAEPAQIV